MSKYIPDFAKYSTEELDTLYKNRNQFSDADITNAIENEYNKRKNITGKASSNKHYEKRKPADIDRKIIEKKSLNAFEDFFQEEEDTGYAQGAAKNRVKLADRGSRLAAVIVDGIIMMIPLIIIMLIFFDLENMNDFKQNMTLAESLLLTFAGAVVFLSFNGYLLYKRGQTLGKMFLEIKIVTVDDKLPTLTQSYLLRNFLFVLIGQTPGVGILIHFIDIMMIFRKDRRCLHDFIAKTKVVKA